MASITIEYSVLSDGTVGIRLNPRQGVDSVEKESWKEIRRQQRRAEKKTDLGGES